VEVRNLKTYARRLYAKGVIDNVHNKAEFDGPCTTSQTEWEDTEKIYSTPGLDVITFGSSQITKKALGKETIRVEVGYEDVWNPHRLNRADDDPSHPLAFLISLV